MVATLQSTTDFMGSSSILTHSNKTCTIAHSFIILLVFQVLFFQVSDAWSWIIQGTVSSQATQPPCPSYCLTIADNSTGIFANDMPVSMETCEGTTCVNQQWMFNTSGSPGPITTFDEMYCLTIKRPNTSALGGSLVLSPCHYGLQNQTWSYSSSQIVSTLGGYLSGEIDQITFDDNTFPKYPLVFSSYDSSHIVMSSGLFSVVTNSDASSPAPLSTSNSIDGNLVRNGGFESAAILANGTGHSQPYGYVQLFSKDLYVLCDWSIERGAVQLYTANALLVPEGLCCLHLNGALDFSDYGLTSFDGSVGQTIQTSENQTYSLSFELAGLPGGTPVEKEVNVSVICSASGVLIISRTFVFNSANTTHTLMGWKSQLMTFETSGCRGSVNLTFESLTNSRWGPIIDNIIVVRFTNAGPLSPTSPQALPPPSPSSSITPTLPSSYSPSSDGNHSKALDYGLGSSVGGILFLVILSLLFISCRKKQQGRKVFKGPSNSNPESMHKIHKLSLHQVEKATNGFSTLIGAGGFGRVYLAKFDDGSLGAVKKERERRQDVDNHKNFLQEVSILSRLRHRHLVNLIGYGKSQKPHILVFEYMSNGSLYERLHKFQSSSYPPLSWAQRVQISCQVASGLEYLHHGADPPIIHRDVKSANILLNQFDIAKITDFGLSKMQNMYNGDTEVEVLVSRSGHIVKNKNTTQAPPFDTKVPGTIGSLSPKQSVTTSVSTDKSTKVRGSMGYLDPEYMTTSVLTEKSDVYSFGVLILELITGRPAFDNDECIPLADWALPYLDARKLMPIMVDRNCQDDLDHNDLLALVQIAKQCLMYNSVERPTMRSVVNFLSENVIAKKRSHTSTPNRDEGLKLYPKFVRSQSTWTFRNFSRSHSLETHTSSSDSKNCTKDDIP